MSRQHPRESIFAAGPQLYRADHQATCSPSLLECVHELNDVCAETHDTQQFLREGTYDLPRLARVLENQRVFLLVNESTVRKYKADLTEEIEPQILELIDRAKKGLKTLERREQALKTKAENAPSSGAVARASTATKLEERRLQMLKSQRLRLEKEFSVLQAEVTSLELSQHAESHS
ncbi:hypothetical protein BD410DRAFT_827452 [Rickenella mellea]|uniref:DASH complex subunit SPC19 n=1 Tax=Rickenella mellea TaxID=50990 RepID=A0A4Y7QA94_9AGAM|nr:hypothetical protein BD410DRAFT_827452 [Rickenella mellea]